MKKGITIFLVIVLLFALSGCSGKNYDPSNMESITLLRVIPDPPKHEVFIITSDHVIQHYDFTLYWVGNRFDYFSDPLPPEGEYTLSEARITESDWNSMAEILQKNRFFRLPEEIKPVNGADFPSYYIEVAGNEISHKSGGYGATHVNRNFKNIWDGIFEYIEIN